MFQREWLDPKCKLVDATVDLLLSKVKVLASGAASLNHILVVVPTAQSGRMLRLALAQRFATPEHLPAALRATFQGQGVLPPQIAQPMTIVRGPSAERLNPAEELAALSEVLRALDLSTVPHLFPYTTQTFEKSLPWSIAMARQLQALAQRLSENGLCFHHVAERIGDLLSTDLLAVEVDRWKDLAIIEKAFFTRMRARGLVAPGEAIAEALEHPESWPGIEEILLPALVDPVPALFTVLKCLEARDHVTVTLLLHADPSEANTFDDNGVPTAERSTIAQIADEHIIYSPTVQIEAQAAARDFTWGTAVGLADATRYPELSAAFLSRGVILHNPARHLLRQSSLGRLICHAEKLLRPDCDWATAAAFVRDDDVRAWLEQHEIDWVRLIKTMDDHQNKKLPKRLRQADVPAELQAFIACIPPEHTPIDAFLREIYQARILNTATPGDREFAAATTAAATLFEQTRTPELAPYFDALLETATYQLEPESSEIVQVEGWLELAWSTADRIEVIGFNEGNVPDAIVGHPFLPDTLAVKLGLKSNERRATRDAFLLDELLRCRAPGDVKLYLAATNANGDTLKPSRLLFRGMTGEAFFARARKLYALPETTRATPIRPKSPGFWQLKLKTAEPVTHISPSGLDQYICNPFEYFLRTQMGFKEPVSDRAEEFDALTFGTLCHDALKAFADSDINDSQDAGVISAFLDQWINNHIAQDSLIKIMQCEALRFRLHNFALWQAQQRCEGWKIHSTETQCSVTIDGVTFAGRYDRLDVHETTGYRRLIDYKTWAHYGKDQAPWACVRKEWRMKSLQLPLYAWMLGHEPYLEAGYYVLGEEPWDKSWIPVWPNAEEGFRQQLEDNLSGWIRGLKAGIFVPSKQALADDLAPFFPAPITQSIDPDWLADQRRRQEALNA